MNVKSVYTYKDAVWIDLYSPSADEVMNLAKEYGLSKEVADVLLSPSARHAVEFSDGHGFLVLHFPAFNEAANADAGFEIDFVVGDRFVITTRYGEIEALEKHHTAFDAPSLHKMPENPRNVLFFGILKSLFESLEEKLRAIDHSIRDIEQRIFTEKQSKTIFELSEASRHLIDFKKITSVWPDALDTLMQKGAEHFGPEFAEQTAELIAHHDKLSQKAATLTEAAHELRETNATILSTKQNELMKVLTIFSVVIAVITGVVLIWLGYLAIKR